MRVMTLFGTRPEIIRLSEIVKHLDDLCDQVLVHTGQNFDPNLSDVFFQELALRTPDVYLDVRGEGFANQAGEILAQSGAALDKVKPDRLLILGDTNSGLSAIAAARMGIPVYHLEAGNRCYDDRVPEEINRRIIDHCSDILMPYTHRSAVNLVREGIPRERTFVVGNPILEVIRAHATKIDEATVHERLGLSAKGYFLATMHRAENVDNPERLDQLLQGMQAMTEEHERPLVVSLHPRTADRVQRSHLKFGDGIIVLEPLGFFDFVALERQAYCVVSDSGTVQEECAILGVPNVTIRDVTERPEAIECGSSMLCGTEPKKMLAATKAVLDLGTSWEPPEEYMAQNVSRAVTKIVLGFRP